MEKELEKATIGAQTIQCFLDQFGTPSEQFNELFLTILFEELFKADLAKILKEPNKEPEN